MWTNVFDRRHNGSNGSAQRSEDDLLTEMPVVLDLSSESTWDVTTFLFNDSVYQFNNVELLVIPEEANWIMTISPGAEQFSGTMFIRYFCDAVSLEFTLVDQVMRQTSVSGGVGGGVCMPQNYATPEIQGDVQKVETTISIAFNSGEGVYGVIDGNADKFMLQNPAAGDITFKRNTNSRE